MSLPAPVIEAHEDIRVVRDDLLPGGTKMRYILPMMEARPEREFVYASPARCSGTWVARDSGTAGRQCLP